MIRPFCSAFLPLVLGLALLPSISWARVFRMQNEPFAAYFGGSLGASLLMQTHFADLSGAGMSIDDSVSQNVGGEFGFLIATREVTLRLGYELIKPAVLKEAVGSDSTGVPIYTLESSISAVIPKVAIELNLRTGESWRIFAAFGAGTAAVSFKNAYEFVDGQTTFAGMSNFSDEAIGTGNLVEAGLGFETLLNDTTTAAFVFGNRTLSTNNYKYKYDGTNFLGSHLAGDKVLDGSGANIASDFSGTTVNVLFRFYIGK